jgi:hypothetical protein
MIVHVVAGLSLPLGQRFDVRKEFKDSIDDIKN